MVAVGDTVPASLLTYLETLTNAWTSWTPTLTNLTLGSGTVTAKKIQINKLLIWRFKFVYGAGSAVGTGPQFTLPATPHADYAAFADKMGEGCIRDNSSGQIRESVVFLSSGSTLQINSWSGTGDSGTVTATAPWTWAANDVLECHGITELA